MRGLVRMREKRNRLAACGVTGACARFEHLLLVFNRVQLFQRHRLETREIISMALI